MRAKLAKLLRRVAHQATIGLPARAYETKSHNGPGRTPSSQVVLASGCTRAAYRQLKKQLRRAK